MGFLVLWSLNCSSSGSCPQEIGEREENEIGRFILPAPFFLGHYELVSSPFLVRVTSSGCWYLLLPLPVLSDQGKRWLSAVALLVLSGPQDTACTSANSLLLSSPQLPHLNVPSVSCQDLPEPLPMTLSEGGHADKMSSRI